MTSRSHGHSRSRRGHDAGKRSDTPVALPRRRTVLAIVFLAVAIIFGGGGSPSPGTELVVQLAALLMILLWQWFAYRSGEKAWNTGDRIWMALLFGIALIPALQLVPLPPSIWHALPDRNTEIKALALVGRENSWMPLSVAPDRTLASLLSLIPPLAMAMFAASMSRHQRYWLLVGLAALGVLAAIVGAVQLSSGNANWLRFYTNTHYGFATGFQANRNAQSDILLIAAMALAAGAGTLGAFRRSWLGRPIVVVGIALLLFSIVFTGSRAGLALIAVALPCTLLILVPAHILFSRRNLLLAAVGVIVLGAAGYALHDNNRVQRTLIRFDNMHDVRPEIWQDTRYAISQSWPVGTGIGTFEDIFPAAERLEYVRPSFANRAHNDYLEFTLETGVVGIAYLFAIIVFAGFRVVGAIRKRSFRAYGGQIYFVVGAALVLLLHSIVDYPLRSMSLACIAGLCAGLLAREPEDDEDTAPATDA